LSSKYVAVSSSEYWLYQFFKRGKECIWPKPGHDLPSGMTSAVEIVMRLEVQHEDCC